MQNGDPVNDEVDANDVPRQAGVTNDGLYEIAHQDEVVLPVGPEVADQHFPYPTRWDEMLPDDGRSDTGTETEALPGNQQISADESPIPGPGLTDRPAGTAQDVVHGEASAAGDNNQGASSELTQRTVARASPTAPSDRAREQIRLARRCPIFAPRPDSSNYL
jgi:hypothetical protein